jgi:hypothetical protein
MVHPEDIVTSRKTSKKLLKLGIKLDTLYYWVDDKVVSRQTLAYMGNYKAKEEAIPAYTTDELFIAVGGEPRAELTAKQILDKLQ